MGGFHHLAVRGVELAYHQASNGDREDFTLEMPSWVPILLSATAAFYMFLHLANTYAFGILVPTLTMVESPSATAIIRETYHDDDSADAPLLTKEEKEIQKPVGHVDEEIMVVPHKPITGKLRRTMRHLREQTGSKRAHWRGVGGFVIYNIATMTAMTYARVLLPFRMCGHLLSIPIAGLLCNFSAAWVQQMVAKPGKSYFQRMQELAAAGAFRKLILPVMAVEVVETAVFMLPHQMSILFGFAADAKADDKAAMGIVTAGMVLALITFVVSVVFVVIPLNIGLVRFQASLLDEQTDTVVPFDRTLGGAEKKGIKSAWKSFTRDGCHRLVKNYIKYFMIQFGLGVMLFLTLSAQMYFIFGADAVKVIRKHAEKAHHMMM